MVDVISKNSKRYTKVKIGGHVMVNLPAKSENKDIPCVFDGKSFIFLSDGKWIIESVDKDDLVGMAKLLENSRDIGFRQGLASVRRALGL